MNKRTEELADRLSEAFGEPTPIPQEVKALLWDIDAESWERGVMYARGPGYVKPDRPDNPYRRSLDLPTEPTWGIAVVGGRGLWGRWERTTVGSIMFADRSLSWGPQNLETIVEFIPVPLTDEQVARIEAAR